MTPAGDGVDVKAKGTPRGGGRGFFYPLLGGLILTSIFATFPEAQNAGSELAPEEFAELMRLLREDTKSPEERLAALHPAARATLLQLLGPDALPGEDPFRPIV